MKYNYLESFRGLMAIWVVIFHGIGFVNYESENILFKFINDGFLPVVAFIILSGFVTHILLDKKETYKNYITRRFLRLFPVYLFAFIVSVLMLNFAYDVLLNIPYRTTIIDKRINLIEQSENNPILNIFSHLTLTHGLFPNDKFPFTYTIMGQSWSLTLEWQFYIFIPFLYGVFYSKNNKILNIIIVLLFIMSIPFANKYMPQKSFLPYMIQYFLIGFFSYSFYKKNYLQKLLYPFLLITAIATIYEDYKISIMILLWGVLLYLQSNNILQNLFENKYLINLGKISYSLYCIHMIVYYFVFYLLIKINFDLEKYSFLIIILGSTTSIILSNLTYKYIELPFIKLGRKATIK